MMTITQAFEQLQNLAFGDPDLLVGNDAGAPLESIDLQGYRVVLRFGAAPPPAASDPVAILAEPITTDRPVLTGS